MSRFWPHSPYAEDQRLPHTILTTHVLTRAVTTGTLISAGVVATRQIVPALRRPSTAPFAQRLLLASSTGSLVTVGVIAVALLARMQGRELIEWQDRSWRLLENQGQVETDDWTYAGMGAGAAAAMASGRARALGWRAVVGGMGLGSVVGMVGYMGWRYGVNGGKFPEKKEAVETSL